MPTRCAAGVHGGGGTRTRVAGGREGTQVDGATRARSFAGDPSAPAATLGIGFRAGRAHSWKIGAYRAVAVAPDVVPFVRSCVRSVVFFVGLSVSVR